MAGTNKPSQESETGRYEAMTKTAKKKKKKSKTAYSHGGTRQRRGDVKEARRRRKA